MNCGGIEESFLQQAHPTNRIGVPPQLDSSLPNMDDKPAARRRTSTGRDNRVQANHTAGRRKSQTHRRVITSRRISQNVPCQDNCGTPRATSASAG
jgi:hypothetical protein